MEPRDQQNRRPGPAPYQHRQDDNAVARARRFLLGMQRADGLWRDFHTLAGQSNDWVTGVVVDALAQGVAGRAGAPTDCTAQPDPTVDQAGYQAGHQAGNQAVDRAVDRAVIALCRRQRPNGGWSYNEKVPTDCDSTAWVMLAILRSRLKKPSTLLRATRYLLRHQDNVGGGFSTYAPSDKIERFIDARPAQTAGWLLPHLGVSAVSMQALLAAGGNGRAPRFANAMHYLLNQRQAAGCWVCYWWCGHGYATFHALRALGLGRALDEATTRAVATAMMDTQQTDGAWYVDGHVSVFETAMMMRALQLLAPRLPAVMAPLQRALAVLRASQKQDGSFAGAPILRIPPPPVTDPASVPDWRADQDGTAVLVSDSERVFTTANALLALDSPWLVT